MRAIYRSISYVCLEVLINIWATFSFLNFVGWAVRSRKLEGWELMNMKWYDTVTGFVVVIGPMVASVCYMYHLFTCDTIVL